MRIDNLTQPLVIVPLDRCTRITEKGLESVVSAALAAQYIFFSAVLYAPTQTRARHICRGFRPPLRWTS
ncbi:MAG TPA: hypothetical protein VH117_08185 [Edaphobacter sp.]|jgi:hypothetical protein|nr:hypothetical protein [Edaphobacter sp.]